MERYSPPVASRVLILAPHPDDEVLGCGGTIARYTVQNVPVRVVIVSDGAKIAHEFPTDDLNIVEIRRNEAVNALPLLGVQEIDFLGFPDGELAACKKEIHDEIQNILAEYKPDVVFSPSPIDYHPDHITVADIVLELFNSRQGFQIAFYEIYETIRFNTLVDISDTAALKKMAIDTYKYSLFRCPEIFWDAVKGLNSFRSLYTRDCRCYEAFWLLSEPIEKYQVVQWLTYDLINTEPALLMLEKIKAVDKLLFQLKQSNELLRSQDSEFQKLKAIVSEREQELAKARSELDEIYQSRFWWLVKHYYGWRDKVLPAGSGLRRLYDKMMEGLKAK